MSLRAPPQNFPQALDNDVDEVVWALRTAGVQWNLGATNDAIEWLLRAVELSIDAGQIERARQIQRNINDLSSALRAGSVPPPSTNGEAARTLSRKARASSLPPPPGYEAALEIEAEPIEVDVELELEEDGDTIEVLEPDVLDDPVEATNDEGDDDGTDRLDATGAETAYDDDDDDDDDAEHLDESDVESFAETPIEVAEPSVRGREVSASLEPDEPTLPPPRVSSRPASGRVEPPPLPVSAPRSGPYEAVPVVTPTLREPWPTSPSFGDNLGPFSENLAPPPPSVVFLAASAVPSIDESVEAVPPPLPPSPSPPLASASRAPESVLGVDLSQVQGLEDLPEDAQQDLARSVEVHVLDTDEEVSGFGLVLVLEGRVSVMPAVMDVVCVQAGVGGLIFAEGHVEDGVSLKVVAAEDGTRVASWPIDQFAKAIAPCPWVRDELRNVGDRLQALAGVAMGRMGELLDEQLRAIVLDRCTIKLLLPGEAAAEAGKPLAGMTIVGAGRLEFADQAGNLLPTAGHLVPGDFVFPGEMLRASHAPATARATRGAALVVFAERKTAHELLMSVPPLIEVLSG